MKRHPYHARRLFLVAGLATMLAAPMSAQNTPATGTTGDTAMTGMGGTSAGMMQDTTTRTTEDRGFPWGLLGLLGLAGLMGRRKTETVHHDTTRTARPGDPNYRV
jgi:MYXO-CTERM domain-containing protein